LKKPRSNGGTRRSKKSNGPDDVPF
jgi:hypothetical protein